MSSLITPDHDPHAAAAIMASFDPWAAGLEQAFTTEVHDLDEATWHIRRTQDVEGILDANKEDANHAANRSATGELKHCARIPLVVAELWLNQYGVDVLNPDHRPAVARLLNSNEWRHLRTGGGRIGIK